MKRRLMLARIGGLKNATVRSTEAVEVLRVSGDDGANALEYPGICSFGTMILIILIYYDSSSGRI